MPCVALALHSSPVIENALSIFSILLDLDCFLLFLFFGQHGHNAIPLDRGMGGQGLEKAGLLTGHVVVFYLLRFKGIS